VPGPLAGVRVLDVSTVVLGPWAAQTLGDMGADIIKVEPPEGDTTRRLGPARHPGMGAFYLACNRNKRSLVLDLKQAAGRAALLRLAATADVILHNFRPGPAARLGLEYEAFRAVNPRLVYCATYGFRAGGPYGNKPAYDDIIQAAAGLASLQAPLVGEPRYVPTIVADKTSSLAVLSAVLAALFHRERTGEGQAIEVPMFETVVAYVMVEHLYGETFVPPIDTAGYKRILNRWRRPFRTKDGYLAVLPYTDADWRAFFALAGRTDLQADPRFQTLEARLANIEALYEELGKIVAGRSSAEWLDVLDRASVPAMGVNTLEGLLTDPQLEATGFWKIVDHPSEGTLRVPDIPTTYSRTPGAIRRLPPRLGEHSTEVLREAGFSEAEVVDLRASGVTSAGEELR
jgi:crotonobetainyl-CoA:carnitine CoA-transferase CaiB-like acyl-CoA transferase